MMGKQVSVVSFDPISEKKKQGFLAKLLITRWKGGKPVQKDEPYGHYMFCGPQGSGKTASYIWYAEELFKKYRKRRISYIDHSKCNDEHEVKKSFGRTKATCVKRKFESPPVVKLYSNVGLGKEIKKTEIFETIAAFDEYANEIRIVLLDEVHTYFPKDGTDKETRKIRDDLISIFSQLRKRNTFILSTAQIYGRLDKALREQCLFMIDCRVNINSKLVNEFIPEKEILCDDLGRWAGKAKYIYVHGLSRFSYDTKKIIRE